MYASIKDAITNGIISIKHNTVCLIISLFIVVFLCSFINALYNFNALTLNIKITGITTIFCKNKEASEKTIPFSES